MISDTSSEYYRFRAARERDLATQAPSDVQSIHMALADRYDEQARLAEISEKSKSTERP